VQIIIQLGTKIVQYNKLTYFIEILTTIFLALMKQ